MRARLRVRRSRVALGPHRPGATPRQSSDVSDEVACRQPLAIDTLGRVRRLKSSGVIASLLAIAILGASIPATAASVRAVYENGKLTLNARQAPAADVFRTVADKTGIRFVVDAEIKPGPITIDLDAMPLERAIRNLIAAIPQAAGHTMTYGRSRRGAPQLVQVALFGPGKTTVEGGSTVYAGSGEPGSPVVLTTPDLDERLDKMIQAGVPRETAERVITLTREVQKLQATPPPGTYRPEDLSPASRDQLQPLIDRGVPMERAVQTLLLQERYQETLKDLSRVSSEGVDAFPLATPAPSSMEESRH